jgi:hypothetical protein
VQWYGTVISPGENAKWIIIERKDREFQLRFHPGMNGGLQFKSKDSSLSSSRVLPATGG